MADCHRHDSCPIETTQLCQSSLPATLIRGRGRGLAAAVAVALAAAAAVAVAAVVAAAAAAAAAAAVAVAVASIVPFGMAQCCVRNIP